MAVEPAEPEREGRSFREQNSGLLEHLKQAKRGLLRMGPQPDTGTYSTSSRYDGVQIMNAIQHRG